jgi:HTH-type transcriptional regulator/antitoxin HipB
MLKNEKQYNSARARLKAWEKNLEVLAERRTKKVLADWVVEEERFGIEQQIKQLASEIQEYEDLLSGKNPPMPLAAVLDDLPKTLIQLRIYRRWTQKELAARLGMQENQLQKYEAENYSGVAYQNLQKIAHVLEEGSEEIQAMNRRKFL